MTKRNLTLGTASGRLGSVVYFRRRGQQIARILVESVNDKRSIAQCYVRARFANYVALWRYLRPAIEASWRGVSRYGSTENAFYRHNRRLMPTSSKEMSRRSYAFPCFGDITSGSLGVIWSYHWEVFQGESSSTNLYGLVFDSVQSYTAISRIGELSQFILNSNVGIQAGDIVHVVIYVFSYLDGVIEPASTAYSPPQFFHHSFVVDISDATFWSTLGWRFTPTRLYAGGGMYRLAFALAPGFHGSGDGRVFFAGQIASYVERPGNPQYSRYSRARFAIDPAIVRDLQPTCTGDSTTGAQFAQTFQTT